MHDNSLVIPSYQAQQFDTSRACFNEPNVCLSEAVTPIAFCAESSGLSDPQDGVPNTAAFGCRQAYEAIAPVVVDESLDPLPLRCGRSISLLVQKSNRVRGAGGRLGAGWGMFQRLDDGGRGHCSTTSCC